MAQNVSVDWLLRENLRAIGSVELLFLCADHTDDFALWSEFLRRFAPRIKYFIRCILYQRLRGAVHLPQNPLLFRGIQDSDLFQEVIFRLIENDCAAMKRFTGTSEEDLITYLAVIAQSVVGVCVRRQRALKRRSSEGEVSLDSPAPAERFNYQEPGESGSTELRVLAQELRTYGLRALRRLSGPSAPRDKLVFDLYFVHGLSVNEIARCEGIRLSKTGVEDVLKKLKNHVRACVAKDLPKRVVDESA